ncbi:metallo-beta-lactamase superfamily protein [Trichomonas vaginalis G3]|uniref:Metallo-beta-lactamase superfamily protein n=1 Tax=Trichomonas vaginalis (strain ATCC PRA-98 / G3) TaxID=412133 RepID=A2FFH1_TRIV3|nr:hydroxyacylglutathione hydrolase gloc family [Trichomonas vaginalis G3]EAX96341.1 metallo-beta-lactamase superfamily protein [Trichomonas vaginalis G3]KAI5520127.1 hydroxyacylglutathione hydrolase gloc family [Trichomonas vaginalis G3]|eukprot:XP_001309271.1 metallo-beta-lactamase superfamily protein [Trichomonas vaginalis G3]
MLSSQFVRFADIISAPLGEFMTKCYIIRDKKECLIVDPADEPETINHFLDTSFKGSNVNFVSTTGRRDHMKAIKALADKFPNAKYYISKKDHEQFVKNLDIIGVTKKLDIKDVNDGDKIMVDDEDFKVIEVGTPTSGGIALYSYGSAVVITGESIPTEDPRYVDKLLPHEIKSITEKILTLPNRTIIMSSHGPDSKVRTEKKRFGYRIPKSKLAKH